MTVSAEHTEYRNESRGADGKRVASSTTMMLSPGSVIAGILGIAVAFLGALAMYRAGLDGTLDRPVVRTGAFNMSAQLGIATFVAGLLLVLGALSYATRGLIIAVGVVMVVGGVVMGSMSAQLLRDVGTTRGTGWAFVVGGVIAVAAASLGRIIRTSKRLETH